MNGDSLPRRRKALLVRDEYLRELAALVGRPVSHGELTTHKEAEAVQSLSQNFSAMPQQAFELPFLELRSPRFRSFVQELARRNSSPVWLWTPRTISSGMLRVDSIVGVSFGFDFSINKEGILVFLAMDLQDRMLLDLFSMPDGEERVRIEVQGVHWNGATY